MYLTVERNRHSQLPFLNMNYNAYTYAKTWFSMYFRCRWLVLFLCGESLKGTHPRITTVCCFGDYAGCLESARVCSWVSGSFVHDCVYSLSVKHCVCLSGFSITQLESSETFDNLPHGCKVFLSYLSCLEHVPQRDWSHYFSSKTLKV